MSDSGQSDNRANEQRPHETSLNEVRRAVSVGAVIGNKADAVVDEADTARELRLGHVRITAPWANAQPKPGTLDGGVIEEVRSLAESLRSAGVGVWVCLLSPEVPRWFDNEGGFTDDRTAGHWWPRWVEAAAGAFGDDIDGWVPFEAPLAIADRLVPDDPRRHGDVVDTLLVAWRDAWRILRGPLPVASSLDVRIVRIPNDDVVAAENARRQEHLRWRTWLRALSDGTITIPGRADRELADIAGACDQLGIAVSGDATLDLEALLQRTAEQGPDRPLALTVRPTGLDRDARAEAVNDILAGTRRLASSLPIARITFTDIDATGAALR